MQDRIAIIRADYVEGMLADYLERDGEQAGWLNFRDYLLSALDRIRKRLGGERHQRLRQLMEQALDQQQSSGQLDGHHAWIESLLCDYYDPMYDYQLSQKQGRILVQGNPDTLREFARANHSL